MPCCPNCCHASGPRSWRLQGCGSGSALIWVAGSGSAFKLRIRIRIQEGKKMTHKNRKKYRIFMFWSARCSLLRAEGFSCSLGVLYGGLGISKLQFLIKKINNLISSCKFFSILAHEPLDPDPGSAIRKKAGSGSVSGSALNQCGSATLPGADWPGRS